MSLRSSVAGRNVAPPRVARQTPVQLALGQAVAGRAQRPRWAERSEAGRAAAAREAPHRVPWHYAKDVSGFLDPQADVRVSRRHVRYAQREVLWEISRLERIRKCGRVPVTEGGRVTIRDNAGVAHYTGLATCGSIWSCPVCSAKIRNARALEIGHGAANWDNAGNAVYMLTLTMPHDVGSPLANLIPVIADGFRAILSGRAWVQLRKQVRIVGTIRSMEVTHGANGWHPHLHVLVFFDSRPDAAELAAFTIHVQRQWTRYVTKCGFRAPNHHGVHLSLCKSAEEAGQYIAKTQEGRSAGNEMARADLKQGRHTSRTPFEVLDDFRWTGDTGELRLWHEYERATRGRQAITWSPGLRELLGVDAEEKKDEELAAAEIGGDDLAVISNSQWRRVVGIPGLVCHLLDQAERGGLDAVNAVLCAYRLGVAKGPAAGGDSG